MGTVPQRARWLLLALGAAGESGLDPAQLQKVLFVIGQRRPDAVGEDFYEFRPYHYGPFDANVYQDADALAEKGMLGIDLSRGRSQRRYALAPGGTDIVKRIAEQTNQVDLDYVTKVVDWAQRLTFHELVRSVYEAFPEMRANSVFRD